MGRSFLEIEGEKEAHSTRIPRRHLHSSGARGNPDGLEGLFRVHIHTRPHCLRLSTVEACHKTVGMDFRLQPSGSFLPLKSNAGATAHESASGADQEISYTASAPSRRHGLPVFQKLRQRRDDRRDDRCMFLYAFDLIEVGIGAVVVFLLR